MTVPGDATRDYDRVDGHLLFTQLHVAGGGGSKPLWVEARTGWAKGERSNGWTVHTTSVSEV